MRKKFGFGLLALLAMAGALVSVADAQQAGGSVIVDFVEDFESGSAGFVNAGRSATLLFTTGGVDDSAFIRAAVDPDFQGVVIRAETDPRSPVASGGAFAGDYIASEVETLSFSLRHDSNESQAFGVRFAPASNFPGITFNFDGVVAPGAFEELVVDFTDPSAFQTFEGSDFETVFSQIGNVQLIAPAGSFNVDVDNFAITTASAVPEPSSVLLIAMGCGGLWLRRRR